MLAHKIQLSEINKRDINCKLHTERSVLRNGFKLELSWNNEPLNKNGSPKKDERSIIYENHLLNSFVNQEPYVKNRSQLFITIHSYDGLVFNFITMLVF